MLNRRFHAQRGQALFETALFMPLFLLGLFGVFLAVSEGALSERVQLGVRYGGVVTTLQNPYLSYSLYSMYATIDGSNPDVISTCGGASASASTLTSGRASFWQPISGKTTSYCWGNISVVTAKTQNILLQDDFIGLSAQTPVSGYLTSNALRGATSETTRASENFFRSPDVGTLLGCTPIGNAVKASLEGGNDGTTTIVPPTPFPAALPSVAIVTAPLACQTFGPDTSPPPATAPPPTPTPSPTPSPTPIPTPTPKATATPVPSATPKPTPTPTPTAVPTATPKATATPVPTATPKATATPISTPTPLPTPTSTPTATPKPTPNPSGSPPPGSVS